MKIMWGGRFAPATHYLNMYFMLCSYDVHISERLRIICTFPCILVSYKCHIIFTFMSACGLCAHFLAYDFHVMFMRFSYVELNCL